VNRLSQGKELGSILLVEACLKVIQARQALASIEWWRSIGASAMCSDPVDRIGTAGNRIRRNFIS